MGVFSDFIKNKFRLVRDELTPLFGSKKVVINFLILGILILGLYLGIKLIRQQQIIKSRAATEPIVFVANNDVFQDNAGKWVTKKPNISLQITSLLGPPATPAPPTPAPGATAPGNLIQSCSADGKTVTMSWIKPSSGAAPTGYTLRVNQVKDVWAPEVCDAKTAPCKGAAAESGDFIPPNVTGTGYTALISPGVPYGWAIQASPNTGSFDRRTPGGSFSCSVSGEKKQISAADAGGGSAPSGLSINCNAGNEKAVSVTFSWTPPTAGATPTGYTLRVNKEMDVWAPEVCDAKTAPCKGAAAESGDFIPPNVPSTTYIAMIDSGAPYGWGVQAIPNTGPFDRRIDGGSFTCPGGPGR